MPTENPRTLWVPGMSRQLTGTGIRNGRVFLPLLTLLVKMLSGGYSLVALYGYQSSCNSETKPQTITNNVLYGRLMIRLRQNIE